LQKENPKSTIPAELNWKQLHFVKEGLAIRLDGDKGVLCLADKFGWSMQAAADVRDEWEESEDEEAEDIIDPPLHARLDAPVA